MSEKLPTSAADGGSRAPGQEPRATPPRWPWAARLLRWAGQDELARRLGGEGLGATLARGAGGAFAVQSLGAVLAYLGAVVLTRVLGVERFGFYTYALTWATLLMLIGRLGMYTLLVRFVAAYRAQKQWGLLRGVLRFSYRTVGWASLALAGLAALVVWSMRSRLEPELLATFLVGFATIPIFSSLHLRQATLRSLRHMFSAQLPELVLVPTSVILMVLAATALDLGPLTGPQIMAIRGTALLAALLLAAFWARKEIRREIHREAPDTTLELRRREWLTTAFPLLLVGVFAVVNQMADVLMLGALLDTDAAGIYKVASRHSHLLIFGMGAIYTMALPMVSQLHAEGRVADIQQVASRAAIGNALTTLPVAAVILVLGPWLLSLFGEGFSVAYGPLVVLVVGQIIHALAGAPGALLDVTGHQAVAAKVYGASAALNLLTNFLLIPRLGVYGAALATSLSTLFASIAFLIVVRRRLGIDPTLLALLEERRRR